MAAVAMFVKPWAMLLFFACIVIPLRLLVVAIVPRSWRPFLESPVAPRDQAWVMAATVLILAMAALFA